MTTSSRPSAVRPWPDRLGRDSNVSETARNAIVFGAARPGIGEACAKRLVRDGYRVFGVTASDADEALEETALPDVELSTVDYYSRDSIRGFLAQFDAIHAV